MKSSQKRLSKYRFIQTDEIEFPTFASKGLGTIAAEPPMTDCGPLLQAQASFRGGRQ
jgi:hypothetical protein